MLQTNQTAVLHSFDCVTTRSCSHHPISNKHMFLLTIPSFLQDALCKVATMNIGLEDTLAYYSPDEFAAGFKTLGSNPFWDAEHW